MRLLRSGFRILSSFIVFSEPHPGIEPRFPAWKAGTLTIVLVRQDRQMLDTSRESNPLGSSVHASAVHRYGIEPYGHLTYGIYRFRRACSLDRTGVLSLFRGTLIPTELNRHGRPAKTRTPSTASQARRAYPYTTGRWVDEFGDDPNAAILAGDARYRASRP